MKGLPQFEFNFQLDVVGDQTKERFLGDFIYQRPNIKNLSNIAKYKTRLDGDMANLDQFMVMLHEMLAQLRFGLTVYPKWWEESDFGLELYDTNVVTELYKKIMEFEKKFQEDLVDSKPSKKSDKDKNVEKE